MPALADMRCAKCNYRFGYEIPDEEHAPNTVFCPSCGHGHDMTSTNDALDKVRAEILAAERREERATDRPELIIALDCWDCGERNQVREVGQSEAFCSKCSSQLRLDEARDDLSLRVDVSTVWRIQPSWRIRRQS